MHDPFNPAEQSLKCISSGLTAQTNDEINCDDGENIGFVIQQNLDNVRFDDASIKRNSKVKSLDKLCPGTLIDKKLVHDDPMILFTRLITLVQREESMTDAFMYEFTPEPISLFKDGIMRKPAKAILRNYILNLGISSMNITSKTCIVGGGSLLHKVKWHSTGSYKKVIDKYLQFVKHSYGNYDILYVVFDGYQDKFSLKSHEHTRRAQTNTPNIIIAESMKISCGAETFLQT